MNVTTRVYLIIANFVCLEPRKFHAYEMMHGLSHTKLLHPVWVRSWLKVGSDWSAQVDFFCHFANSNTKPLIIYPQNTRNHEAITKYIMVQVDRKAWLLVTWLVDQQDGRVSRYLEVYNLLISDKQAKWSKHTRWLANAFDRIRSCFPYILTTIPLATTKTIDGELRSRTPVDRSRMYTVLT
jgi:hypothetical protein